MATPQIIVFATRSGPGVRSRPGEAQARGGGGVLRDREGDSLGEVVVARSACPRWRLSWRLAVVGVNAKQACEQLLPLVKP
eukprot:scaffold1151_cov126-Isochrysis_galbana.AAC.13